MHLKKCVWRSASEETDLKKNSWRHVIRSKVIRSNGHQKQWSSEETSTSDLPNFGSPSNLFSLEKHLGGELIETPQKATKSSLEKIDLVNQQLPKPTQQNYPEPTSIQTQTQAQAQDKTIPVLLTNLHLHHISRSLNNHP